MKRLKLKIAVYLILVKENKILLSRRFNTGWQDGNYSLPSGHLELNEMLIEAMLREVKEEIGIKLKQKDIKLVHVMHRKSIYVDFYFLAKNFKEDPKNMEPKKCDNLEWFPLKKLPKNIVSSVRYAIQNYQKGILFSELKKYE